MASMIQRRVQASSATHRGCQHGRLSTIPSTSALESGYQPYTNAQVFTASTGKRKQPDEQTRAYLDAFPSPLGLPGDEITIDPKHPTQSLRSWLDLPERNPVTSRRKIVYVAAPPSYDTSADFMKAWCSPTSSRTKAVLPNLDALDTDAIIAYLRTFYHGLEVRLLPVALTFMAWDDDPKTQPGKKVQAASLPQNPVRYVGLSTGKELIGIRVREKSGQTSSSSSSSSPPSLFPYTHQLDLNDLTDAALSLLPSDAYALLLTTVHDIYESAEDDFCCGRAWGASRVAIVSSARYRPFLDDVHGVDREHLWPASHCESYAESKISTSASEESTKQTPKSTAAKRRKHTHSEPTEVGCRQLEAALRAHRFPTPPFQSGLQSTFLLRVCRTASHELGHCFGLDHCMYRACVMQGTASVAEDMRQPPYLCPVCEAKVAWAVLQRTSKIVDSDKPQRRGRGKRRHEEAEIEWEEKTHRWRTERHLATKEFCEGQGSGFAALGAWSGAMLEMTNEMSPLDGSAGQ